MSTETRRSPHVFNPHNLLTEIMQGLLILATIAIPVVYFAASSIWLIYGIFLFAYIATGFIRAVCRQLYQFILLCLMVVALPLVLPLLPAFSADIWPRLIVIPTLLFFCGRAFYLRIRQDEDKVVNSLFQQSLAILYLLVLNLLAIRLNLTTLSQAYFYVSIVYLMLALYRWHRLALASQLQRFLNMPTQPADRIMHFNKVLLLVYVLITLAVLLLSPLLRMHDLLPLIGSGLLVILKWLFTLFDSAEPQEEPPTTPAPTQSPGQQQPMLPMPPGEKARWLAILQDVFLYLLVIAVGLLILAMIGMTLYSLYKRFYATAQPSADKMESLLPSLREDTKERIRRVRERFSLPGMLHPADKIRRSFFRLVLAQQKRGFKLNNSMTPRQIIASFDLEKFPDLDKMVLLYEAARYGPDICTAEDAEKVNIWYRKMRKLDLLKHEEASV